MPVPADLASSPSPTDFGSPIRTYRPSATHAVLPSALTERVDPPCAWLVSVWPGKIAAHVVPLFVVKAATHRASLMSAVPAGASVVAGTRPPTNAGPLSSGLIVPE